MDSETQLALDSNVLVAATVGPADRLWPKWKTFDAKAPASRFVPSLVLQEFYEVTEGVGSAQPGILPGSCLTRRLPSGLAAEVHLPMRLSLPRESREIASIKSASSSRISSGKSVHGIRVKPETC